MNPAGISLELFPEICDKLPHLMWLASPDGHVRYVNRYGLEYLGISMDELCGWSWVQVVHAADREPAMHAWIEATSLKQPLEIRYRMLSSSGRYRWNLVRAQPVLDSEGNVLVYVGTCTDVEDWKQGQRDLSSANREIDTLLALLHVYEGKSPVGFCFLDLEFRYARINDTMARMNGKPRSEHLGRSVRDVLPKLWPAMHPLLASVVKTGEPIVDVEAMGETPAAPGEVRHWKWSYYPVSLANELLGIAAIVTDTTEEKKLQAALQKLKPEVEGRSVFPRSRSSAA